ncbi:protein of unknown function [Streptomyces sp. KY75]|nr:protein of unknown function [Streptomyces sp. KY70]CAD5995603.1 protein of unknown function [Streptomyces sp. KY75]
MHQVDRAGPILPRQRQQPLIGRSLMTHHQVSRQPGVLAAAHAALVGLKLGRGRYAGSRAGDERVDRRSGSYCSRRYGCAPSRNKAVRPH